ncbi:MAG: hypothetical protein BWY89_01779 [Bacteroidetes bacterium ADurb.BinA012]|nr:MAG: hypothetical protein BWY89_01779 [Bacteroidetes bacterium ADurb.BinA012]
MSLGQPVPHGKIPRQPITDFSQDQEKHCEPGNKLDDKLCKVIKYISQQTSQYTINKGDAPGDEYTRENRDTSEDIEKDGNSSPFRTHVKDLYYHPAPGHDLLCGQIISDRKIFGR